MNLIVNARDAIEGEGTLQIHTRNVAQNAADASVASHGVEICVKDDGIGMREEVRARMFEPFFTTKPQGAGTGMGLAMVYGIIDNHGGTIDVQSTEGEGTCVCIRLPQHAGSYHGTGVG